MVVENVKQGENRYFTRGEFSELKIPYVNKLKEIIHEKDKNV